MFLTESFIIIFNLEELRRETNKIFLREEEETNKIFFILVEERDERNIFLFWLKRETSEIFFYFGGFTTSQRGVEERDEQKYFFELRFEIFSNKKSNK